MIPLSDIQNLTHKTNIFEQQDLHLSCVYKSTMCYVSLKVLFMCIRPVGSSLISSLNDMSHLNSNLNMSSSKRAYSIISLWKQRISQQVESQNQLVRSARKNNGISAFFYNYFCQFLLVFIKELCRTNTSILKLWTCSYLT